MIICASYSGTRPAPTGAVLRRAIMLPASAIKTMPNRPNVANGLPASLPFYGDEARHRLSTNGQNQCAHAQRQDRGWNMIGHRPPLCNQQNQRNRSQRQPRPQFLPCHIPQNTDDDWQHQRGKQFKLIRQNQGYNPRFKSQQSQKRAGVFTCYKYIMGSKKRVVCGRTIIYFYSTLNSSHCLTTTRSGNEVKNKTTLNQPFLQPVYHACGLYCSAE